MPNNLCLGCEEEFDADSLNNGYCAECADDVGGDSVLPVDVYMDLRKRRFYAREEG